MSEAVAPGFDPTCALTAVHGTSASLRRRVVDAIVNAHLSAQEREWGLTVLDAEQVGAAGVVGELAGGSLMATSRVVVVRNAERLPATGQRVLAKGLESLAPETAVVLDCEETEDYRRRGLPLGADLRKVVQARGQVVAAAVPEDRDLPAWAAQEMAARGKRMPAVAARVFVERVGNRVDLLLNEMDKLALYLGPERTEVGVEDIEAVCSGERESTVFELVDAIGRRDVPTALAVLPDLLPPTGTQSAALSLLAMIARQFRLIWQARALSAAGVNLQADKLPDEWVDRLPKEHGWVEAVKGRRFLVTKYLEQSRNFTDVQLVRALVRVYETDLALKGQTTERVEERAALESLIVALCRL